MEHRNKRRTFRVSGIGKPVIVEQAYAYSVSGGAGGSGTKISTATFTGGALADWYAHPSFPENSEILGIWNEKHAMQDLNDRLAKYIEQVGKLEEKNRWLEVSISQTTAKKGSLEGKDYSKYYAIIADLRAQILGMQKDNAALTIKKEDKKLAAEDFKVKANYEASMSRMIEADVNRQRKTVDDTNLECLQLESEVEYLMKDLVLLKKNHEEEVQELRNQVSQAGVHVDVDSPKGQDISRVIEEMRITYEKLIDQKKKELKAWHESKVEKVQVQVTENTTALKEATAALSSSKKTVQDLAIKLQTAKKRNETKNDALCEIKEFYDRELAKYKRISEELEAEKNEIEHNRRKYKLTTEKLQAEINEYKRLLGELDGGRTLRLEDAVDSKTTVLVVKTETVDGKVVSETKEVTSSKSVGS